MQLYELPQFQSAKHYTWNLGQWVEDARFTPYYTGARLDSVLADALISTTYIPYQRMYLQYDGSGRLSRLETYTFDGAGWNTLTIDSFTYNPQDQIDLQYWFKYSKGSLISETRFTHTYDANGQRTRRLEEALYPPPLRNDDDWHVLYDANGNILAQTDMDWDGAEWVDKSREVWSYDSNGSLTAITAQRYSNGSWTNSEEFVLNGAVPGHTGTAVLAVGTVLPFDTTAGDTQLRSVVIQNTGTATLSIPAFNLVTGSAFYFSDTSSHTIAAGTSANFTIAFSPANPGTYYDTVIIGRGATAVRVPLMGVGREKLGVKSIDQPSVTVWPNPASTRVEIEWGVNRAVAARLFDANGREMARMDLSSAETEHRLDLRSVPSGSYALVLQDEHGAEVVRRLVVRR